MSKANQIERPVKPRHAALVPVHQGQQRALASVAEVQHTAQLARHWCPPPSAAWCGLPRLSLVQVRFASEAHKEPRQPQLRGGSRLQAQAAIGFGVVGVTVQIPTNGVCVWHGAVHMDFAAACDAVLTCAEFGNESGAEGFDACHDAAFLAILRVPYCPAHVLIIGQQTRIARTICKLRKNIFSGLTQR